MMALEIGVPPEVTATMTVPADVMELETVNEFIHTELDRRLCPVRIQSQIDIAVEELFVNICKYAYESEGGEPDMGDGTVRVSYTYSAEPQSVIISLMDEGVPYNPLEKPDAVTPGNVADIPIGGLGILLAKKNVSSMEYQRDGNANILTITKKW
jgi:anti-sigma regulatory factor (Ser/Thr protein kinase)